MRILACRDPATAFLRIRPTQEINTIFKAVIAALVSLWTISANAQTPTLEPAPYRPLPVGTTIWYDKQNATVMETDGMEMVLKLNGGSDWISLYGMFLRKGEWQYTTSSNNAFVSKISDEALSALKQLWPLKVGNRVSAPIVEVHAWQGAIRQWTIELEVTSTAFIKVGDARYATYVIVETGKGDNFQVGGVSMEKALYKTTHWYDPTARFVIKSETFAIKASGRDEVDGKRTVHTLSTVAYPKGTTTHALKPQAPPSQQVATRSMSEAAKDSAAWEEVKHSNRVSDFQRYLKEIPSGMFVRLVESQMRSLIERQANPGAVQEAIADIQYGNYHALVIGANAYKHLPKLKTAINDAKSIAEKLESLYGFKVRLLLDPTRDDIIDTFGDYLETLEFQDNLLIYYAGHG